jgi:hypothetical protein
MKPLIQIITLAFLMASVSLGEELRHETSDAAKGAVVSGNTVLTQALGRADLAVSASRLHMRQLQGAFGEHQAATYLNRGAEWTQMRQRVGPQGIDMLHFEITPDGRITDMMVSEVKTGGSRLGQTLSGKQMSLGWGAARMKSLSNHYSVLSRAVANRELSIARTPSAINRKQVLEVPLGNRNSAQFWRENSLSPWKLSATPNQVSLVERQAAQIAQWLNSAADGHINYRSRIFRQNLVEGNLVMTVKDASPLNKGVPESKLPLLSRTVTAFRGGGAVSQSLTSAFAGELRRTQPMLNDGEVMSQARELTKKMIAGNQGFKAMPFVQSLAKGAGTTVGAGGVLAGAIDLGAQLWISGEVNFQQVGANALVGGTASTTGFLAGSGVTYALTNTTLGLDLSKHVASSMGISTSCSANLLGSTAGGGVTAAVFSYGLYFMGYADLETANRMAVAGVAGSAAGAAALAATTSLVAAYATAGTGTAIATLHGAAATSATMAAIGGGSAAAGSALAMTGVGLVVVGVGAGVMWGFTAFDAAQETERLELTAGYLLKHFGD